MTAILSPCETYRYRLERDLGMFGPVGAFIMVNPSTANASVDDQTIRKVKGFAIRLGWSRVIVGNIFAYRATDINKLATASDPIGPENMAHLEAIISEVETVICAWGTLDKLPPALRQHWRTVQRISMKASMTLHCLGTVKDGHPKHPLTLGYSTAVEDWSAPAA